MLQNRTVPDVQRKRTQWRDTISGIDPKHLIFLDESGVNLDMTRLYARGPHNQRVTDHVPLNTPTTTTVLSSIRINKDLKYTVYQGGTTAAKFKNYLEKILIPSISPGDIVVMDNMRSHHAGVVTELLKKENIDYLYLPPYSPDLNPIEKLWSKMKISLRKAKIRTESALSNGIQAALREITPQDCKGWYRFCGYVQ